MPARWHVSLLFRSGLSEEFEYVEGCRDDILAKCPGEWEPTKNLCVYRGLSLRRLLRFVSKFRKAPAVRAKPCRAYLRFKEASEILFNLESNLDFDSDCYNDNSESSDFYELDDNELW